MIVTSCEHLEILVEVEAVGICFSLLLPRRGGLLFPLGGHDASLLIIANTLLEKVGLAGKRDVLHLEPWSVSTRKASKGE